MQLSDSADARFLRCLLSDNSHSYVPFGATYYTFTSDSALDLCFFDSNAISLFVTSNRLIRSQFVTTSVSVIGLCFNLSPSKLIPVMEKDDRSSLSS